MKSSGIHNWDISLAKNTQIHDNISLQFRMEFYNLFNRVQFAPPVTQADNPQFDQILQQANEPRRVQGALRLNF